MPLINVFGLAQCKSTSVDSSAGICGIDHFWASIPFHFLLRLDSTL